MFLLPALAAGSSDVLILYLTRHESSGNDPQGETVENGKRDRRSHDSSFTGRTSHFFHVSTLILAYLQNVSYLVPLAIIRLFLLLIPLPYHTFTGTAVKCPNFYRLLHWTTLLVILIHMLSIIMLDPDSLNSFLPDVDRRSLRVSHQMRHVWILLSLSLWSTVFHIVLLWHVRSTAQQDFLDSWKRRNKALYYYAKQNRRETHNGDHNESDSVVVAVANDSSSPFVLPNEINGSRTKQQWRTFPGEDLLQQMRCISDGGNGMSILLVL